MSRRIWKRLRPPTLRDALRLCKDYAQEARNLSVERIADLMGVTADSLYKWLATGRMPVALIPAYENVCGINFVTRWLASSAGMLLIDIPSGRTASTTDMQELQAMLHNAVGQLLAFYGGKAAAGEALSAIQQGMEGLAWHRVNVEKHAQPELGFTEEQP